MFNVQILSIDIPCFNIVVFLLSSTFLQFYHFPARALAI